VCELEDVEKGRERGGFEKPIGGDFLLAGVTKKVAEIGGAILGA